MTYCLAMALNDGLVLAADSRTNAGVDHISTFRKMRIWRREGERVLVLLSAGNLAITQAVIGSLENGIQAEDPDASLMIVESAGQAARLVGDAVRKAWRRDAAALKEAGVEFNISLILGGQIKGDAPRLFLVYAAGNFIEATPETPYFQIGETKYGKPILDRVITPATDLDSAAKCALLSLDSTFRSNMTVGPPIDLLVYRRDSFSIAAHQLIQDDDPYFNDIRTRWGQGLKDLFQVLPDPPWET
ncbi:MAG: proteasome-type protease [Pseudomonadota bacterium]